MSESNGQGSRECCSELNWDVMGRKCKIGRCKLLKDGGASRARTDDLIVANDQVVGSIPTSSSSQSLADF
jgi:hypothetical protein